MTTTGYPTNPKELTTEWLTAALGAAGALRGTEVTSFSTSPVGEGIGMLGILARVAMDFDKPAPEAPRSVIAKFPSTVPGNRAIGMTYRLYEREVNFYTRITSEIEGLAAPRCYGGQYDPTTGDSFLLLEDLAEYRTGDQVAGCTAAEAMMTLDAVIPLHASYWDRIDHPLPFPPSSRSKTRDQAEFDPLRFRDIPNSKMVRRAILVVALKASIDQHL